MPIDRDQLRKVMPGVAAVLDHPWVAAHPQLTAAIERLANKDEYDKMGKTEIALAFGILTGALWDLLQHQKGPTVH